MADSIIPSACRRIVVLFALVARALAVGPAARARAQTVVSLTFERRHDPVQRGTSAARFARDAGGGWVPIVFHDIDNSGSDESVSPATFTAFLDWLQPRASIGTVVRTVRSVMGYPDVPASPAPPAPLPVAAADKTTAFASLKAGKRQRVGKLHVSAAMAEAGTLSASGTVKAGKRFKLGKVSAAAIPGKLVTLRLELSKNGLRAVKRALRRHKLVRALITITARDAAGNVKTAERTVTLRL